MKFLTLILIIFNINFSSAIANEAEQFCFTVNNTTENIYTMKSDPSMGDFTSSQLHEMIDSLDLDPTIKTFMKISADVVYDSGINDLDELKIMAVDRCIDLYNKTVSQN